MAREIDWTCFECIEMGSIFVFESHLSVDTPENTYYWGFLAYSEHKLKSPECETEPAMFDIETREFKDQPV